MKAILDFYVENHWHPVLLLVLYWLFWPGLMFAVAAIFESRMVYLGKGQSRMFMPGDFMLSVTFVTFLGLHTRNPVHFEGIDVYGSAYWLVTCVICAVLGFIIRQIDIQRCPQGSIYSPTKLAHDISGYFISLWLIAGLGLPQIVFTIQHPETFAPCKDLWTVFFLAAGFFVLMAIWDIARPVTLTDQLLRHPVEWQPIWKTHKITRTEARRGDI